MELCQCSAPRASADIRTLMPLPICCLDRLRCHVLGLGKASETAFQSTAVSRSKRNAARPQRQRAAMRQRPSAAGPPRHLPWRSRGSPANCMRRVERQRATAEVLGAISRSKLNSSPILQSVVDTASQLCRADASVIFRLEGGVYRFAAGYSLDSGVHRT